MLIFYIYGVFVRKKKNKSGVVSVQIIDKSTGTYKVLKTIGSSSNQIAIESLMRQAQLWIQSKTGVRCLDFDQTDQRVEMLFDSIESVKLAGIDLLLGRIFDEIGFNQIGDEIFKQLVLYRLMYPGSKLKTTEYLYRYQQIEWDEDQVYRYLDKLHNKQKDLVQKISYDHTLRILEQNAHIVFYDVTTLYFEIEREDELRRTGFNKDGKHQNPQIILGLLVSKNGYPLAYDIFNGSQFEGHTMLPVIRSFKEKYQLENLIIVADAGLLSQSNMALLVANHDDFILGARIKNENKTMQEQILQHRYKNGTVKVFDKGNGTKLIISYSDKRATKDALNRERGLKRLEKLIRKGKLTKSSMNNKGYNKYLKLEGDINISIDYDKYKRDSVWDGLKGYITNCSLQPNEIIENYSHLWQIEKAFRVTKTDLKIRPIYHRLPKRIEAHICLNFVAYKIYKELERQLLEKKAPISATKAIEIASFIFTLTLKLPNSEERITKPILKSEEQVLLATLFKF